jgi:uncharacterized membrane protein
MNAVNNMVTSSNRKLPVVAGILMLAAATFNIAWLIGALTRVLDIKALLRASWVISPFPYVILDIGFGGNTILASVVAIIFVLGIILSIVGGIFALRRRAWGVALTGSLGAFICVPLFGIAAAILIVVSKNLFVNRNGFE